ncbi:hypothetical protein CKAN_02284900 [Cinnamomum micranthum f. kanehirae]|uniref:DUF4220 domain-containing protein n=1 Tax=Cinnamomum micranthum f. kanehirae TaxID=337451 RepID=A0A3S3NJU2_9MAGN|nr:hypothetical protein CKAN_02284900 [Cinnamomum micranthum f. kanehirae]
MNVLPKRWTDLWNEWSIRVAILISLLFQIFLIMFASRRRNQASKLFILFIWSVYLLADWIAICALGLICSKQGQSDCNNYNQMHDTSKFNTIAFTGSKHNSSSQNDDMLLAFWAPFLLLHLGGPDTITAFAMEDNELWPRHLITLLFEVASAAYVFILSIPNNHLLAPTLLMFLAGIIKYSERNYALYLGSLEGFRDRMLKKPEPSIDYGKLMEEYAYRKECGEMVDVMSMIINANKKPEPSQDGETSDLVDKMRKAYRLFDMFKGMIVERTFSYHELEGSRTTFLGMSGQDAFQVVEFELNFLHEVLFTKAVVLHNLFGYVLRAICSCSIMVAFVSFFFLSRKHRFGFRKLDIAITYTLLGGAICLDAFALVMLILSDWTIVKLKSWPFCNTISKLILRVPPKKRWSASVSQYNLINHCIPADPTYLGRIVDRPTLFGKVDEMLCIQKMLRRMHIGTQSIDELQYSWDKDVTDELKEYIFGQLKEKPKRANYWKKAFSDFIVEEYPLEFGNMGKVDFDEGLLMWHMATDLCYFTDENAGKHDSITESKEDAVPVEASMHRKFCKILSDYLVYLLVMQPSMMPSSAGIGRIRYRDTCAEAKNYFHRVPLNGEKSDELIRRACHNLLFVTAEELEAASSISSVLLNARILAKDLKHMKAAKRWKIMSAVWTEMLVNVANQCPGIAHAQRLNKGGELLTFVWFLMNHLGSGELSIIKLV